MITFKIPTSSNYRHKWNVMLLNKCSVHSLPQNNWYYVQITPATYLGGNAYGFESPVLNTDKMWDICHTRSGPCVRMLTSSLKKESFLFLFRTCKASLAALFDLGEISWLMKPLGRHMNAMSMSGFSTLPIYLTEEETGKSTLPFLQVLWGTIGFV